MEQDWGIGRLTSFEPSDFTTHQAWTDWQDSLKQHVGSSSSSSSWLNSMDINERPVRNGACSDKKILREAQDNWGQSRELGNGMLASPVLSVIDHEAEGKRICLDLLESLLSCEVFFRVTFDEFEKEKIHAKHQWVEPGIPIQSWDETLSKQVHDEN